MGCQWCWCQCWWYAKGLGVVGTKRGVTTEENVCNEFTFYDVCMMECTEEDVRIMFVMTEG